MSKAQKEYELALNVVLKGLLASTDENYPASVQISTYGDCVLRLAAEDGRVMSIREIATYLDLEAKKHKAAAAKKRKRK